MAENGSVAWQFKHVGQITISADKVDEDELTLTALDAGAEDIQPDEDEITVFTAIEDLHRVNDALTQAGYKTNDVALTYIPTNKADLNREDSLKLLKLLDMLEELDDVQETYVNVDISEDVLQEA